MRMTSSVLALLLIFALVGCGGGDEPAGNGGEESNVGKGKMSGLTRPEKIPESLLKELSELEVEGFERKSGRVGRGNAMSSYVSKTANDWGRKANARVMVTSVPPGFGGAPDPESLKTNRRNYMRILPPAHIENPDLVFEGGSFTLPDGRVVLHTYARSYVERKTDSGTSRSRAHSLRAWTHDESRLVEVTVDPGRGGARVGSAEEQAKEMTKEEMIAVAKPILTALAAKVFAAE